jgi:UDP-4-amino-4-deoxy-L-arabinose formyltransferase/UDP-glucuronic acid dehydrogenase (UDP-4-keto-hexauronic acid decarboxylating)
MRLLILSEVDDWDLGPRLTAAGHEIVAWARPAWRRNTTRGPFYRGLRSIAKVALSQARPVQLVAPRFDALSWLEMQKIPRLDCPNVNDPRFVQFAQSANVDVILVCFYSQILKSGILQTPRLGAINCHPSLLPRYRGPQPTFWMLKNGESFAGVTVHRMTEKIDVGQILAQRQIPILENENAAQLLQRQHHAAAELLVEALAALAGTTTNGGQESSLESSYFGRRRPADTALDWNASARQLGNLLRALQPYEPLRARFKGRTVQIYDARPHDVSQPTGVPGEIISKRKGRLLVQTGSGVLEVTRYEIDPFHGWINRILQTFLLPVGERFDVALAAVDRPGASS